MKTIHLFAGAGGGLLCDLILGHEPIAAVEWEKSACDILRSKANEGWFPELRVYEGDVRVFDPSDYEGRVGCIHAGFPCQDISVAGKQAGLEEGTRSGLYREVLRIAGTVRPRYLFLENVAAILNNGLGTVLGDLAALGYDTRWCCIRASDVGAPHGRDRWWCLAERTELSPHAEHEGHGWGQQQPQGVESATATVVNTDCQGLAPIHGRGAIPNVNGDGQGAECRRVNEQSRAGSASDLGQFSEGSNSKSRRSQRQQQARCNGESCEKGLQSESTRMGGCKCQLADTMRIGLAGRGENGNIARPAGLCDRAGRDEKQDIRADRAEPGRIESALGLLADGLAAELGGLYRGWFEVEPDIGRTAPKRSTHAAALKALGNGQLPLQGALAWQLLMK